MINDREFIFTDTEIGNNDLADMLKDKPNLRLLNVAQNVNITKLPPLPDSLIELDCFETGITHLLLPRSLEYLDCTNCQYLVDIDISRSYNLQILNATGCKNLRNIIGDIPQTLNRIDISHDELNALAPETAQKLLDYYNSKDTDFQQEHSWWQEKLQPIADRIQMLENMGFSRDNLFEGGKRIKTRKQKGKRSKRRRTRKQKGKRSKRRRN